MPMTKPASSRSPWPRTRRGSQLGTKLLASLVRRARRDGYETIEGLVVAENTAMLALARKLTFTVEPVPGDSTVLRVQRALQRFPRTATARQRTRRAAGHHE